MTRLDRPRQRLTVGSLKSVWFKLMGTRPTASRCLREVSTSRTKVLFKPLRSLKPQCSHPRCRRSPENGRSLSETRDSNSVTMTTVLSTIAVDGDKRHVR